MVFSDFYSRKSQKKPAREKIQKGKATKFEDEPVSKKKSKDGKKKRSDGDTTAMKHKARPEKKARFQKPSEDALKLSEKLKEFSSTRQASHQRFSTQASCTLASSGPLITRRVLRFGNFFAH